MRGLLRGSASFFDIATGSSLGSATGYATGFCISLALVVALDLASGLGATRSGGDGSLGSFGGGDASLGSCGGGVVVTMARGVALLVVIVVFDHQSMQLDSLQWRSLCFSA